MRTQPPLAAPHRSVPACRWPLAAALLLGACAEPVGPPPELPDRSLVAPAIVARVDDALAAIGRAPRDATLRLELGLVYDANALNDLAGLAYEQAVALDGALVHGFYHLARVRGLTGDVDGAIEAMRSAIELHGDHAPAHWRLGTWLLEAQRLDEAEAAFERARALDPGDPAGPEGLALVAMQRGEAAVAVEVLTALLRAQPDNAHALRLLGTAYRELGRLDEASQALAASQGAVPLRADAWMTEVRRRAAGYLAVMDQAVEWGRAGQAELAVGPLEELYARDPDDTAVLQKLTGAYMALGRLDRALEVLEDAAGRRPDHHLTWLLLALVHEQAGRFDDARRCIATSIDLHPTYVPAHELAARLHYRDGDLEASAEALAAAVRYGGHELGNLVKLARTQGQLGRWQDAVATLQRATDLHPDAEEARVFLAEAQLEARR